MKRFIFSILLITQTITGAYAQSESPYKTSKGKDGAALAVGLVANTAGLLLIQKNKNAPSDEQLAEIDRDPQAAINKIPKFDRFAAGNYSATAKTASDFICYPALVSPFLLLLDKDVKSKAGQVAVIYLETMALTGAIFTLTVANTTRNRPLVYNSSPENDQRKLKHSTNSFFAGHTANTASATFFAAKVFHDFNPNSEYRPLVWAAAAAIPAAVGYFRIESGKHFLSDNIVGFLVGAGSGILVPQLHKKSDGSGISVIPISGEYTGMMATVTF